MLILVSLYFIALVVNSGSCVYTCLALTENISFAENDAEIRDQVIVVGVVT